MKKFFSALFLTLTYAAMGQDTLPKLGNNIVDIHAAYQFSEDVHQSFGLGGAYERILDEKRKWGLYLPFTFGISRDKDYTGFFEYNDNSNKARYYQCYSFAPGIKWYTGRKLGKVKYSLGPSLYFETGNAPNFETGGATRQQPKGTINYTVIGYMLTNALDVYVTPQFSIGAILGTGFATNNFDQGLSALNPFKAMYGPGVLYQCFLKAGYRF